MTTTIIKVELALLFQQQRTVYRLTLVKSWNVDELQAYAELVSLGSPDFIEVKVGLPAKHDSSHRAPGRGQSGT